MSKNVVLIIGAGLSSEPAGLSLDKDFLQHATPRIEEDDPSPFLKWALNRLYSNVIDQERSIEDFSSAWRSESLEIVWSEIYTNRYSPKFFLQSSDVKKIRDKLNELARSEKAGTSDFTYYYYHAFEDLENRSPNEMLFLFAGWDLRRLILDFYGNKRFSDLSDDGKKSYGKLLDRIFHSSSRKTVISFNYDVILDDCITDKNYVGVENTERTGEIQFIKPHGSTNWYQEGNEKIIAVADPIKPNRVGFKNRAVHRHSIIPPIDKKFSNNEKSEAIFRVYHRNLPEEFKRHLLEADEITIIGYSFPLGDQHIRSLLTQIANKRKQDKLPYALVRYVDLQAESQISGFTIKNLFFAKDYEFIGKKWTDWAV